MDGTKIRNIAALSAITGIVLLAWLSTEHMGSQPETTPQDRAVPGSRLTVQGTVVYVEEHPKVHFLKLTPASPYPLVSFKPFTVKPKDTVRVRGTVKEYKGELEIVVDHITVIT